MVAGGLIQMKLRAFESLCLQPVLGAHSFEFGLFFETCDLSFEEHVLHFGSGGKVVGPSSTDDNVRI